MKILLKPLTLLFIINFVIFLNISASISAGNNFAYTVMPGDTVIKIAVKFNISAESIIEINKLSNPSVIIPGQVLVIPKNSDTPTPAPTSAPPVPTATPSPTAVPTPATVATLSTGPAASTVSPSATPASVVPTPTPTPTPAPTATPSPTPKPIGPASEMKISANFVNCDSKMVLQALALSMDKRILMLQEPKQKSLTFRVDNTPLLPIIDEILKNEGAASKNLDNTIVVEPNK